jgi:hypothetical protein
MVNCVLDYLLLTIVACFIKRLANLINVIKRVIYMYVSTKYSAAFQAFISRQGLPQVMNTAYIVRLLVYYIDTMINTELRSQVSLTRQCCLLFE